MKSRFSAIALLLVLAVTSVCFAVPTLTGLTAMNPGTGVVTLVMKSSGAGSGFFTLRSGSSVSCGTGSQVAFGPYSTGSFHGSLPLFANVTGNYTVRNLKHNSAYTACYTAADNPGGSNLNPVPIFTNLSTNSAKNFSNADWSGVGSPGFSPGAAHFTSLAFAPDSSPYLAYVDANDSNKLTVMNYSEPDWNLVGSAGFASGTANTASLAFAPDGSPHVAYVDAATGYATVRKFSGGVWGTVGIPGFSADTMATSLAFAPDGSPLLAYIDGSSSKITVIQYDGSAWNLVGGAGVSVGGADFISLAIAPDGTPFVAYSDYGNYSNGKVTVMKYNGTAWDVLGSAGFSAGIARYTSLAIAPDSIQYVAYQDGGKINKATVMRYNGTSWVDVSGAGLSAGGVDSVSLAIAADNTPFIAFRDWNNSYKATLMKYLDSAWSMTGGSAFPAALADSVSLALAPDGSPYLAYGDVGNSTLATVQKLINFPPTISGSPADTATVGVFYTFTPTTTYALGFSGENLPPGLGVNPATGVLSGTPTTTGTYNSKIVATNDAGSAELLFTVIVVDIPDTAITSAPANPSSSAGFSFDFSSTVPGSTFECSLNSAGFSACLNPYSGSIFPCAFCRTDTAMGFAVRAKSTTGRTDESPATSAWIINQTVGALINNVLNGGTVQLQATDLTANVNVDQAGVSFTLKGGYDSGYSANSGLTTIQGTVTLSAGTVTIENIVIR